MSDPQTTDLQIAAGAYFDKGRCSGHSQFNGRYCRDAAGPERWCIHCAGFMLLSRLHAQLRATEKLLGKWRVEAETQRQQVLDLKAEVALYKPYSPIDIGGTR